MACTLHISIKECIAMQGIDVLTSTRLANILADYNAYEDVPAAKQVMKEFLVEGYGIKIVELYTKQLSWKRKMQSFAKEFTNKHGYKDSLVKYTLECIEYGLNWIDYEPTYDANAPSIPAEYNNGTYIPDMHKQLMLMQKEYIAMLEQLITIPQGGLYKKSGYYTANAESQLWVVENKINIISAALGTDFSYWCKTEKQKVLDKYYQNKGRQFLMVLIKVIAPIVIVAIAILEGALFLTSKNAINEFNAIFTQADSLSDAGNDKAALICYQKAQNGYSGNFQKSKYINKAKAAAIATGDKLVAAELPAFSSMLNSGTYYDAKVKLDSLTILPLSDQTMQQLISTHSELEESISKAIQTGKLTLTHNIESHKGHLDQNGKKMLIELLKVAPEDYWLNFIKQKEKIK